MFISLANTWKIQHEYKTILKNTTSCADLQRPGEEEAAARPAGKAGIKYITPDDPALQGQGHYPDWLN